MKYHSIIRAPRRSAREGRRRSFGANRDRDSKKAFRAPETRRIAREAMAGYQRMNDFSEQELRQRLPAMTEAEARKDYEELCLLGEHTRKHYPDPQGEARLDRLHIDALVARRNKWNTLAEKLKRK